MRLKYLSKASKKPLAVATAQQLGPSIRAVPGLGQLMVAALQGVVIGSIQWCVLHSKKRLPESKLSRKTFELPSP